MAVAQDEMALQPIFTHTKFQPRSRQGPTHKQTEIREQTRRGEESFPRPAPLLEPRHQCLPEHAAENPDAGCRQPGPPMTAL